MTEPVFKQAEIAEIGKLLKKSSSLVVIGLPAMGISIFLKRLAQQDFGYFIHINIYEMQEVTKTGLFKLLYRQLGGKKTNLADEDLLQACKMELRKLVTDHGRLIIIFNRFDKLVGIFDELFFSNIRSLKDVNSAEIKLVFSACRPIIPLGGTEILGNFRMYNQSFYLLPFSPQDLGVIIQWKEPELSKKKAAVLDQLIELSGGHYALLLTLLRCGDLDNPLLDHFVNLQLRELFEFLTIPQKKQVQDIANGIKPTNLDPYLLGVGMVREDQEKYQLFSPLFTDYIRTYTTIKLRSKEKILFNLLQKHLGNLVSKDEIYTTVWRKEPEGGSEWALNALVYRLRKNPYLNHQGYQIENHKKEGYVLYKA